MFAIITKYRGPTQSRGSRIYASHSDGAVTSVTTVYAPEWSAEKNHRVAFQKLMEKLREDGFDLHEHWASWSLNGDTRVWVPVLLKTHDNIVQVPK